MLMPGFGSPEPMRGRLCFPTEGRDPTPKRWQE